MVKTRLSDSASWFPLTVKGKFTQPSLHILAELCTRQTYLFDFLVSLLLKSNKASSNIVSKSSSSSHSALVLDALDCFLESMMLGAK